MTVVRSIHCTVVSRISPFKVLLTLVLAFLMGSPVHAQRQAARTAQFQPGQPLPLLASGNSAAIQVQQLQPLAMASADFDEDGVADLAIGYSLGHGGAIALMRGNLDALAPQSYQSWLAAGQGRYASPFLAQANMIAVPVQPGFLKVADINGDGHLDIVFAARNGSALYVLLGDGKGNFALQAPVTVAGAITALAAFKPGDNLTSDAVIAALNSASGPSLALLRASAYGLQLRSAYALPGPASAIEVANLDSDLSPDAAIVAGGQLVVMHGSNALNGAAQFETLPLNGVEAVTSGDFLFDRHAQLQLSVLTTDGTVHVLAHSGFDSTPYTRAEITAARRESMQTGAQTLAQKAGNTGGQPWTEIESYPGVAPSGFGSSPAIMLHGESSGSGGEDIVVINPAQREVVSVQHASLTATANSNAAAPGQAQLLHSALGSGGVVAALSQRISPQGADGLVVLNQGSIQPLISTPASGNMLYVNTAADTLDANDSARCTFGSGETCSLRDAVTYANLDSASNISAHAVDTIMVPGGTYNLTLNAGSVDGNGDAYTHLDITGPMTIIGVAGSTIVDAKTNDKVFSIDPNLDTAFNTTLENLTMQNGKNNNNPGIAPYLQDNYGGAIDWEAFGTGNLNITNCTIQNSKALWGPGGGIFESNGLGGAGKLTITNSTISSNSTAEEGGGVDVGYEAAVAISGSTIELNSAKLSVNGSDPGGVGQGGGLFIAQRGISSTPQSTIAGGAIQQNEADSDGGGIYTNTGLSITGSANIASNSSGRAGGGIFDETANAGFPETTSIASANLSLNSAVATGGGITVGPETKANGNLLTIANSRFYGNTSTSGVNGLSVGEPGQSGAGGVTATENWWGCNAGPTTPADGCDQAALYDAGTGSMSTDPHVVLTLAVSPNPVLVGNNLKLTAAVNTNSSGGSATGQPGILLGMNIAFGATVGGFSASPSSAIDASGNATANVTPTSGGAGSATAKLDGETVTTPFTVNGLDHFSVSAPSAATAGASFNVTVTAQDSGGNTFAGYSGTVHFTSTDGSAMLPVDSTLTNGVGVFSITLKTAGSQTVSVNDTVTTAATGTSGGISVSAGAATHFSVTAPSSVVSYTNNQLTVKALDSFGNVATGYSGTVTFTSSDTGYVNASGNGPLTNGVGTFNFGLKTAGLQTITATDSVNSAINGTSNSITVLPGPASYLGISAPSTATAGTPINVTVTARDLWGNVATGYTGTVHFTSTDASATLPADSTLTNGSGLFAATLATGGNQTIAATDTVTGSITGTSGNIAVTVPAFVVTVKTDDAAGVAANCPSGGGGANCSLRDALAAASAAGSGNISFDPAAFAAPQTITLGNGTLNIPSYTAIQGATTGAGATLTNLVTVSGNNAYTVFTVNSGVKGASLGNLIVGNGFNSTQGSGINNAGTLVVSNSTISGNAVTNTAFGVDTYGAGIYNSGTLTLTGSTISGNAASADLTAASDGGGIWTSGTLTVSNSTISGNTAFQGVGIFGAGGTLTIVDSTISGNTATGSTGGLYIHSGTATALLTNSVVLQNSASNYPDVNGTYTDNGGNLVEISANPASPVNPMLAALGNYGGPTQTMIPLPGSPAICAISPSSATGADQRGFARTTTYGGTTCQDSGAAQTNYALNFTAQQPSDVNTGVAMSPAPIVTLTESGNALTAGTATVSVTDADSDLTTSPATSGTSNTNGGASFGSLKFTGPETGDKLTAGLTLNAGSTPPAAISVDSGTFNVIAVATHFSVSAPSATTVGSAFNVTVTALDAGDNKVTTYAGTVHFTSTDVAAILPADTTLSSGVGTFSVTLNTTGAQTVIATDTTNSLIAAGTTITVNEPPAVTSTASATFTVGTPGTFSVTSSGYPKASLSETGALPSGVTFTDNGNGTASLSGTPAAGTGGSYSLTITGNNGVSPNATQSFTLTVDQPPAVTSSGSATFTAGTPGMFTVTASGYPAPTFSETGALPTGVTLASNGTLSGTPAAGTGGSYALTITANNGVSPNATQSFTLTVDQAPAVTSSGSATFTTGTPGTFTVTSSGYPKASLSETGVLPSGITFTDTGNGTATLSGTPAAGTGGSYSLTITGNNGVSPNATQSFTLAIDQPPAVTSAGSATFTTGTPGTFTVTSSGYPKASLSETGALPGGVTFTDNGNGTASLSGTPAAGTGGSYSLTITGNNGVSPNATQSFTLTVDQAPAVTSAGSTTFTVGTPGAFSVTSSGYPASSLSETGALPSGVTFTDNGNGTASLSGTPAAGTGGSYSLTITGNNGIGSKATQNFTLTIDQAPAIITANSATFTERVSGSFTVSTTAYPAASLSESGALPTGVTFTDNGNGTATLAGPPAAGSAGSYPVMITAGNGIIPNATQSFTLTVNPPPAFVVSTTADDASGVASNCPAGGGGSNCSLRDALAASATLGGLITFSPSAFPAPSGATIALGSGGTLNVPSNATIMGLTTGSGALLTNLVTVSGGGSTSNFSVFTVGSGVTGAAITNLTITNGYVNANGGGIDNAGELTVTGCTLSDNYAGGYITGGGNGGGGIYNASGTLVINNSTFSANTSAPGGAMIADNGSVTINDSTFSGNSAQIGKFGGAIFINNASVTINDSTFSGNTAAGGGAITSYGALTVNNSILSGDTGGECISLGSGACPANGVNGNVVGGVSLSALGSYGGPTLTVMPLPGSSAICGGAMASIPGGVTVDQRGNPRTTTAYGSACVDAGAAQTAYSLSFTTSPSASQKLGVALTPAPQVQLLDNGTDINLAGVQIGVTLAAGSLTGTASESTGANGVASFTGLSVSTPETSDTLTATASSFGANTITALSGSFSVISITLSPGTLPSATVGVSYSQGVTANGGTPSYSYTVSAGALPAGLSLDSASGALTGTPTAGGTFNFTVQAKDSLGFTGSQGYTLIVSAPVISLTPGTLPDGIYGASYSQTITANGGTAAYQYKVSAGALPGGLTLGAGGALAGTATATGPFSFTVTATDSSTGTGPYAGSQAYSVSVGQASSTLSGPGSAVNLTYGVGGTIAIQVAGQYSGLGIATPSGNVSYTIGSGATQTAAITSGVATLSIPALQAAGGYTVAVSYAGDVNYKTATPINVTLNIQQATATIHVTPYSVTYDATAHTATGTATGVGGVNLASDLTLTATTHTAAGTYAADAWSFHDATGNYADASGTVSDSIGQAKAAISVTPYNVTYDATAHTATGTATGVGGVNLASDLTLTATTHTAAGTYAADAWSFHDATGNYADASGTVSDTIGKATLIIMANNASKVYGTANPAFTGSVTGQQTGDTFTETFATGAGLSSPVNIYAIVPSVTGTNLADYTQSVTDGTLTISKAGTSTTLKVSHASVTPGQSVTLSAQVVSQTTGTPSGTVSFYDGTALLDTETLVAGTASYSTTALAPGVTHVLTVVYIGDSNFSGSSSTSNTTVTVAPLDFTMVLSGPSSQTVVPGSSITYKVTVTPDYGSYAGTVSFAVSDLPPGATVTFSPSSIAASGGPQTITVTIQTAAATAALHPAPPPTSTGRKLTPLALAFLLLFGMGSLRKHGRALRRMLCVMALLAGGAAASMLSGCGGGINGFFGQSPHNYTITITATAGGLTHTETVTLNVQ